MRVQVVWLGLVLALAGCSNETIVCTSGKCYESCAGETKCGAGLVCDPVTQQCVRIIDRPDAGTTVDATPSVNEADAPPGNDPPEEDPPDPY